jgi:hypothetical protein
MEIWALFATAVGSFATAFASFLNWRLLRETALLRLAQTEPSMSLHLERGRHLNLLNLMIQNSGQATAYSLRWEVTPPLKDLEKYGVALNSLELLNGFEHLAPKQRIETFFGNAIELLANQCPPIAVTVRFKNSQGTEKAETFTLNPCQFAGISEVGDSAEDSIAKSLDKIAKELGRVTSQGRLRVVVGPDEKPWLSNLRALRRELDAHIKAEERAAADEGPPNGSNVAAAAARASTSA